MILSPLQAQKMQQASKNVETEAIEDLYTIMGYASHVMFHMDQTGTVHRSDITYSAEYFIYLGESMAKAARKMKGAQSDSQLSLPFCDELAAAHEEIEQMLNGELG